MKIGFNARTLSDRQIRGWSRYTINLLEALARFEVHFYLFSDRKLNNSFLKRLPSDCFTVVVKESSNYFSWEQKVLPSLCAQYQVDVLHCPINYGLPMRSPCPTVLTLHDAIEELFYYPKERLLEKIKVGSVLWKLSSVISRRGADRIITVSDFSKNDFVEKLNVPEKKIRVIYEAADPSFKKDISGEDVSKILKKFSIDAPYVFYVGGWEERKNIPFLLEAFKHIEGVKLVLAGGKKEQISSLKSSIKDLGNKVKLIGWVEDEELPMLYAGARALVYPSLYEGFGLQVCEAMSCGCPVLVSNKSSLPEIAGKGGITFDLQDEHRLAQLIKKIAFEDDFFNERQEAARNRSRVFSWDQTAEATWHVYRELI